VIGPEADGAVLLRAPVLTPLDPIRRADHVYLSSTDRCSFMLEWIAKPGPARARCRQLLRDFKCPPSAAHANARGATAKQQAIDTMAQLLRAAVSQRAAQEVTWVPVPPSKAPADSDFDDRLLRTLARAFNGYDVDLRCLLYQAQSTPADHLGSARLGAAALLENLCLDVTRLRERPVRRRIQLFDDVLTTGKHYKCCEQRLRDALPRIPISGVFLLRRGLPRRWRGPY
jgi:hypothetical protein